MSVFVSSYCGNFYQMLEKFLGISIALMFSSGAVSFSVRFVNVTNKSLNKEWVLLTRLGDLLSKESSKTFFDKELCVFFVHT